jgi:hypothetical protein
MVVNPIFPYHRADAPASFLYTTVIEMCHWALTSLNRGIYQGQRILSPGSYDVMWKSIAQRGYPPFREAMGLGWALGHFDGIRTIAHGGGGFGWTCHLILLPEKNSAAVILCNEESSAITRFEDAVISSILGMEPQPGTVSWMIPIVQALQTGGMPAAYTCYADILNQPDFFFDPYELFTLVYQLQSVKKHELALDVLKLNLHAFPGHQETMAQIERLSMVNDSTAWRDDKQLDENWFSQAKDIG